MIEQYNVVWTTQSHNSGESMPCGGGDVGVNVWVENDEVLFYMARAGCRDENGALLKLGRCRIKVSPNLFGQGDFHQELKVPEGYVLISSDRPDRTRLTVKIWVEVYRPIVHVDIKADIPVTVEATYESWRTTTIELPCDESKHDRRGMCMINYDAYPGSIYLKKDNIRFHDDFVRFHHRVDNEHDCFAFQVRQQELEAVRQHMVNPLENLVWGGAVVGDNFTFDGETDGEYAACPFHGWKYTSDVPAGTHRIRACLHTDQTQNQNKWDASLQELIDNEPSDDLAAWNENVKWWSDFWSRSHVVINSGRNEQDIGWRVGRNYQLFRFMLACNSKGREATLFNGGLFTFDPLYVNGKKGSGYTPDHRQWGAAFTAQNQRLLYWPMLKNGDFDHMPTGFSFYINGLKNSTARVRQYWKHGGCSFEEQSAVTGLPGSCQYGFTEGGQRGRPDGLEAGIPISHASGMIYEGQLEFSWLILRYYQFSGADLTRYLPFIEESVIFYDEHYRFRNRQSTGGELNADGKLVIYPANTLEDHWNARNPTSVIAGLTRVLTELCGLPDELTSPEKRRYWRSILAALPEMPVDEKSGKRYLMPTENHNHRNWVCPEMYPLWPYELYGLGLPDFDLMKQTSLSTGSHRLETDAWQQANIHAARLGDVDLAVELNAKKMDNGPFRFPAFWPETVDWAPDHNWGGSGMIGIQEMLMQTHPTTGNPDSIQLLPAWPTAWNVHFKLHAPGETVVECDAPSGGTKAISVSPREREGDLQIHKNNHFDMS